MRQALIALALLICAQFALGQHPNDARGFEAGKVYNFNDVDTVSSFNGNLMVHLPIGPAYMVNGALSYRLGLFYNSHVWRFDATTDETGDVIKASPIGSFNAGLGWTLSLGRLFEGGDPETTTAAAAEWTYQSSDGADHNFYETLHHGAGVSTPDIFYTRDGSYMRLSKAGQMRVVELGDGTKNEFTQMTRTGGVWPTSTTGHDWLLTAIADQFGNRVTIGYSTVAPYAEIWTITDGARTTRVYFNTSGTPSESQSTPPSPSDVVLDHIDTKMVGGALATYGFATQGFSVPLPMSDTTNRPGLTTVTVLTAVTPPTGNPYRMILNNLPTYDITQVIRGNGAIRGPTPGALTRLVLPTLGSIGWSHDRVQFTAGSQDKMRSPAVEFPIAVIARNTYDASGQSLGTWTYGRRFSTIPIPCLPTPFCLDGNGQPLPECPSGRSRQLTTWVTEPTVPGGETKTTINYFSNYESISTNPNGDTCDTSAEGWSHGEHGLPFTRYAFLGGRFLSSEVRTGLNFSGEWNDGRGMMAPPAAGTDGKQVRATYVAYQLDNGPYDEQVPIEYNATPTSTATYFYDDTSNCGSSGTDPCFFTAVNNLGFDTYGHFRQTSTDGNLPGPGTGSFRTTFTNYNAAPAATAPWLLNTSSERCTVDEGSRRLAPVASCDNLPSALITKTQFDANGSLTARRTLLNSGGTLAASDLLTTFKHDAHGNLTLEQYYGGDTQTLGVGDPFSPPGSSTYAITHALTYAPDALTRDIATYANGVTASDVAYDPTTGMVTDTKDVAGLPTHYTYDLLGRITSVQPPGTTPTTYTYTDALSTGSVFTPAKVLALTDASSSGIGKISKEYQYDSFGRLWRQKSLLPDDGWNIMQTDFDVLGRKTAVSQPERLTVAESNFVPTHKTTFSSYDAFGRARVVQSPDSSITRFTFAGVRSDTTRVNIHTVAGDTDVDTTELHDGQNRLISITEPNGTITSYGYDAADHLTSVTMPGENSITQHRYFHYDARGFLQWEQHPELGISGDGTTTYSGYDARGHAHNKLTGSSGGTYDLKLTYDAAERLIGISDAGASHSLKVFTFGETSGMADYGRLLTATRSNTTAGSLSADVVTTETYKYESTSGRPSERDTEVKSGNTTIQSFKQLFTYDTLGAVTAPGYPTCLAPVTCTIPPLTTATNVYTNGLLTSVPGFGTLSYNGNGMLGQVAHAGNVGVNVIDTITPDDNGMARPKSIDYSGWSVPACSPPTAPSLTAASSVCPGSTGNSASVTAVSGVSYAWSISGPGAQITSGTTGTSITYNAGTGPTVTLMVTASACSASATTNANVAVGNPTVTVSNGNSPNVIQAVLTGTAPWSITWSDNVTQSNVASSPVTRTVAPGVYSVTAVSDHNCSGTSSGTATVLATPQILSARTLDADSTGVHVTWTTVPNATSYSVQRRDCPSCGWGTVFTGNALVVDDHPPASATRVTYLYRIVALANGTLSFPSSTDFATTATSLFAEPIVGGVTPIRASHVRELRLAIDAVRASTGLLPAYTTAFIAEGWPADYSPPTGLAIRANDIGAMRRALDDAMSLLNGSHIVRTNPSGITLANDFNQLREGVR